MENWQAWWADHWPAWQETLLNINPLYYALGLGGLLLLLTIRSWSRNRRKSVNPKTAPQLQIQSFQIAPLGRDAFFKIHNAGPPALLSAVRIRGRDDVKIKNSTAGQRIETGKEYRLLLEAAGDKRISSDFTIEVVFAGPDGRAYQQLFNPNLPVAEPIKRI